MVLRFAMKTDTPQRINAVFAVLQRVQSEAQGHRIDNALAPRLSRLLVAIFVSLSEIYPFWFLILVTELA